MAGCVPIKDSFCAKLLVSMRLKALEKSVRMAIGMVLINLNSSIVFIMLLRQPAVNFSLKS